MTELKADRKIIRARVQLQKEKPFFSYLVLNLNMIERKDCESMGVNSKGDCFYNSDWVEKLSEDELKAVLCHEVLHIALFHLIRLGSKEKEVWNYATDIVINNMLVNNSFSLPRGLVPYNNSIELNNGQIKIEDVDKKTAEEVYSELMKNFKQEETEKSNPRFDEHFHSEKSEQENAKEIKEIKDKWKRLLSEAVTIAKQKGELPSGIERIADIVLNERVNWKNILYKYITRELAFDYTYSTPSKKSQACGVYMPNVLRENIEIIVAIDTSGSIQQAELNEFLGEIITIAKSFNNIKIRVLFCDSEVQEDLEVRNGDIAKILSQSVKGGGGTSFTTPLDYIKEKYHPKFVLFFTDGYGDKISRGDYPFRLIWFLSKGGSDELIKDSGDVIKTQD